MFRARERLRIGRFQPAEAADFFDAARFQRENDFRQIEPFHLRQFLRRAIEMLALRPKPQAMARRGSSGAAGALIGGSAADFFDEQGVDAAARIEPRDARQAAVDHDLDSIDRERSFGHVRRDDGPAFLIMGERGVLLRRRQFAVERQDDKSIAHPRSADGGDGPADLVFSGHEDEHVAFGPRRDAFEFIRGQIPDRIAVAADRFRQVFDRDRKGAAARSQDGARLQIFLQKARIQRRGHDGEFEIGARRRLELEGAGERDVAVEMALVKFIEENRGDAAQLRILNELAQEDSFGDEANAGAIGGDVFEADLVADFVAEPAVALGGDARGEETGGEAARLQDHDLAVAKQSVIEEDLRDLGGFSGAGRRLEDEAGVGFELGDESAARARKWAGPRVAWEGKRPTPDV